MDSKPTKNLKNRNGSNLNQQEEQQESLPQLCKRKLDQFILKARTYAQSLKTSSPLNLIDLQLLDQLTEIFLSLENSRQSELGLGDGGVLFQTYAAGAVPSGSSQYQHQFSQATSQRNPLQNYIQQQDLDAVGIQRGDQTQKMFIEALFHSIFCQNTFLKFKQTQPRLFSKSAKEIVQELDQMRNAASLDNDLIDVNQAKKSGNPALVGRMSRHETYKAQQSQVNNTTLNQQNSVNQYQTLDQLRLQAPQPTQGGNQQSTLQYFQSLFGERGEEKKNLFDMCVDLTVYILLQMHQNEDGEVFPEVSSLILQCFVKHLRMHQTSNATGSQMQCLQVYLALNKLFQNSKHFLGVAKDKEVLDELFGLFPLLFKEETVQVNQSMLQMVNGSSNQELNLNQLVLGQGSYQTTSHAQNQNGLNAQMSLGHQSVKSSSKLQIQHPNLSPVNLNSRGGEEEKAKNSYLDRNTYAKKASFNRASSEPPSAIKNAVAPVQEDSQDEDIDYDKKGSQEVDTNRVEPKIPGLGADRTVPPLMMSQVQSVQNQLALQQQYSNSNSVMNNYFNMPISQMSSTSMSQAFKLNFIPQNTLAKSRLTRRQMSISRKQTLKLNSVTNFNNIMYGDESAKNQVTNQQNSYDMQVGDQTYKSSAQQKKGPLIPKLNINSIVNDNTLSVQRAEGLGMYTTSHAQAVSQLTNQNKSSNRSNRVSAYSNNNFENQLASAQKKMSGNQLMLQNYHSNQPGVSNPSQFNRQQPQMAESEEQNISIYDEINGSFVDDLADGQNGYLYDNAEEKLRQLAFQLGESCLTNDLAALISQKREIELVQSARKTAVQPRVAAQSTQKARAMSLKPLQRSISVSYTAENIFKSKNSIKDLGDIMNQVTNLQNQRIVDLKNQKLQEIKSINQRARIVVMNLAYMLLKKYDIEEVRFLRHPIQALNAFLGSENFQNKKHFKQILALENQSILIDSNIDHEMAQDGKVTVTSQGRIINPSPNKIQFQNPLGAPGAQPFDPNQLQQITEANQSDTEEVRDEELNSEGRTLGFGAGQSNLYLNTQDQNDDSRFSYNIYGNGNQVLRSFESFQKLESGAKLSALLKRGSVFQQQVYQEEKIVFKIYKKFTFLNEDILRRQVTNELATFAAKDKGIDLKAFNALSSVKLQANSSFSNNMFMVNNLMNHGGSHMGPPISGTPIRGGFNQPNLSFDEGDEDFCNRQDRNPDGLSTLSNPNTLWFHNGIAYEVNTPSTSKSSSASSTVSKERLRKKLDVMLYTVDRRLKYLIQMHGDKTHTQFAVDLQQQLGMFNSYLESQNNRIMLYQVIEVCLESILMIKKCLIDIALKTNIFIMDFSKHMSQPDFYNQGSNSYKIRTPQKNQYVSSPALYRNAYHIENQKAHRNNFSEFLRLVANLLRLSQTPESMKLLNEVLVFDEQWQESVKTFSISLFLSDIVATISITDLLSTQQVSLMIEELRGVNLINFEEPQFIAQVVSTQSVDFYQAAKESIFHLLLCSLNMMRYFKGVLRFYNHIVKLYFSNYGQYAKTSGKYPASGDAHDINKDNAKLKDKSGAGAAAMGEFNSGQKNATGEGVGVNQSEVQTQKYWKQIVRKMLYQYMYLVTPPNGLLSQYLQNNSINFVNSASSAFQSYSASRAMSSPSKRVEQTGSKGVSSYRTGNPPLNFKLTKAVLSFTRLMFHLPDKFTKYVFIEELMLFYIRTHYISFIRLYNKNYSKNTASAGGDSSSNLDPDLAGFPLPPAFSPLSFSTGSPKDISLQLCKKHLECLFCIAKNRNEDTRRKLYQFKLVHFLTQEIELEFDLQQRRKRFIEMSKEEQKKIELEQEEQAQIEQTNTLKAAESKPKAGGLGVFKLNLNGIGGASMFTGVDPHGGQKVGDPSSQAIKSPIEQEISKPKGPPLGVKMLNITGLGLSEIKPEQEMSNKTANGQVAPIEDAPPRPAAPKKLGFAMPKLNVAGLGLSELKADDVINMKLQDYTKDKAAQEQMNQPAQAAVKVTNEPAQTESSKPPAPKKLPFAMPKLNVSGLGLSELKADDVINMKIQDYSKVSAAQEQATQQEEQQQHQTQPKKLPFQMPKLNIVGLGLSELTQEETKAPPQLTNPTQSPQTTEQQIQQSEDAQGMQPKKPSMAMGIPKLNITGLTLSELAPSEEAKAKVQVESEKPVTELVQKQAPKGLGFKIPALNITGLGLTDIIQEEQKTQIQPSMIQNDNQPPSENPAPVKKLGFAMPKLNITGLTLSEIRPDDNSIQQQPQPTMKQPQNIAKPTVLPNMQNALSPAKGQGRDEEELKTIDPNTQVNKTIDYGALGNEQIFKKQPQNFDKTAPFKLFDVDDYDEKNSKPKDQKLLKQGQRLSDPQLALDEQVISPNASQLLIGSQGPLSGSNRNLTPSKIPLSKSQHGMIVSIPEEELDEKRKQLLKKNRVNLLPNKRKSVAQSTNRSQSQTPLTQKQSDDRPQQLKGKEVIDNLDDYAIKADGRSSPQSPKGVNMRKNIQSESKIPAEAQTNELSAAGQQQLKQLETLSVGGGVGPRSHTPSNVAPSSRSSNGSFIGRNKVFVPFLKFPEDIHIDPSEKIKIYQKPDDNRFKLIRAKDGATPEIKRGAQESNLTVSNNIQGGSGLAVASSSGGLELNSIPSQASMSAQKPKGKRGKMLNINSVGSNNGDSSGTASQAELQQNAQKPLTFNFPKSEEQPANNRPVNIPKPERKVLAPPPLPQITRPHSDGAQLEEGKTGEEAKLAQQLKKPAIPNIRIPEKQEKAEGADKIKEQLEYAEQLQREEKQGQNQHGDLTQLEQHLNQQKKFQLLLDKTQPQAVNEGAQRTSMAIPAELKFKSNSIFSNQQQDQSPSQGPGYAIQKEIELTEANFYLKERNARPIYQDEDLHVLMISLLTCLLLRPERGILDELYCSQYPIDNGKQNILYLMHHHLNHQNNQPIIQRVLTKVQEVHPPLAGQRLLKLLCTQLFDLGLYNNGRNWKKIAEGAYAKVYEGETNLSEPQFVAIKQMMLPSSIYARCVLHDIFTEITCLEELRLEPCVTDLYDYGVDSQCYYIVQKRYAFSLREWRLKQSKSLNENLSIYLSIFREFLRSLQIIHSHNVTHYDIKCDNVLIDSDSSPATNSSTNNYQINKLGAQFDEDRLKLSIADFGECRMYQDERDELCQRNRGTDYYKSPEMLQLTLNTRKDTDKYDRRKQVGTTRLSDIWSAGCMFFELITGQVLFYNPDYFAFLNRVTRHSEALLTPDKLELVNNNVYLVDFLKYMLVRDARLRPSIDSVVKRFEHVYALLVSTTAQATNNPRFSLGSQPSALGGRGQNTLDQLLEQTQMLMTQNSLVPGVEAKEGKQRDYFNLNLGITSSPEENSSESASLKLNKNASLAKVLQSGHLVQILEDVYLANEKWFRVNKQVCVRLGITHVVIEALFSSQSLRDRFDVLEIADSCEDLLLEGAGFGNLMILPNQKSINQLQGGSNQMNPFLMMTSSGVMDYLRKVALQRGRVIFIEGSQESADAQSRNGNAQRLMRECLLISLGRIFSAGTYETYTLIKSQNLFFKVSSQRLATLSKWSQTTSKINQYMQTFPRFSCLCGQCLIVLKRQFANYQAMQTVTCNCSQYYKNVDSSQCPSPGCNEFLKYLKTYFRAVYQAQQQALESLHWGFLEEEDFLIGPNYLGQQQHNSSYKRMVMSNMSQGVDQNSTLVSICEKKSQAHSNMRGAGMKEQLDFNLISKSSATVKNYGGGGIYPRWKLYKCKDCHVWTHAVNEMENKYAVLLNNRVKDQQNGINILAAVTSNQPGKASAVNMAGINAKQNAAAGGANAGVGATTSNTSVVRVPILNKIKLTLPF